MHHVRQALRRQPALHAGAPRHAYRAAVFLHRAWGPLEPFDNSFAEILHKKGVYSHLVSDHYHYWEDGGATYHNRYDTFEFIRGQERDPWKAMVEPPWERLREQYHPMQFSDQRRHKFAQYMINREFIREYADFPSVQCFDGGLEFLDGNRDAEDWLLHVETFDPHEPFFAPDRVPRRLSHRLPRPDPRLAAVRARDRSARGVRRIARELLRDGRACATTSSAGCWITWTGMRCGTTPR